MVGLFGNLAQIRAALVEKRQRGAEMEREGAEKKRWADVNLELLDQIEAEARQLLGVADDSGVALHGQEGADSSSHDGLRELHSWRRLLFGGDLDSFRYLTPDYDGQTGRALYALPVVAGKGTNRRRAFAAARVYGPKLDTASLADTIFRTGETKAVDAESVKSSLGTLVRYGQEWKRSEGGVLEYVGDGLTPNQEMILKLLEKRQEKQPETS